MIPISTMTKQVPSIVIVQCYNNEDMLLTNYGPLTCKLLVTLQNKYLNDPDLPT